MMHEYKYHEKLQNEDRNAETTQENIGDIGATGLSTSGWLIEDMNGHGGDGEIGTSQFLAPIKKTARMDNYPVSEVLTHSM